MFIVYCVSDTLFLDIYVCRRLFTMLGLSSFCNAIRSSDRKGVYNKLLLLRTYYYYYYYYYWLLSAFKRMTYFKIARHIVSCRIITVFVTNRFSRAERQTQKTKE